MASIRERAWIIGMGAAILLAVAGCQSDSGILGSSTLESSRQADPPELRHAIVEPATNLLLGGWDGFEGVEEVGADEIFLHFAADSTYLIRYRFNAVISSETGHWTARQDSLCLHAEDIDGEPIDTTYRLWHHFQRSPDTLALRHVWDGVYEIVYARAN